MNRKFILRLFLLVAFSISLHSCRNDYLPEQTKTSNPNASKFRMVKLKDIPNVENFIYRESGRKDMKVPLSSFSASGKQDLTIGNIETSTIVEANYGDDVYYVFKVENMNTTDAVYNLEVKKTNGEVVRAQIIEYDPKDGTSLDFQHFTGSVTSYSLQGKPNSSVGFTDGSGDCPPLNGSSPSDPNPGTGSWGTPNLGGPFSGGSGGSHPDAPFTNTGCTDIILDSHGNTAGWYDHCRDEYYPNPNAHKNISGKTNDDLTADCGGDDSGVIITDPPNPCQKIRAKFTEVRFKQKVTAIDKPEVFNYDHEMGFASAYPVNTTATGTQYQPMENSLGTHNVALPDGNQYFGYIHSHNNESSGGQPIKIFSPADVITFLTSCVRNADEHGSIGDAYCMVITSEGNYILQYTGTGDFSVGPNQINNWKKWYLDQYELLAKEDELTQINVEKTFARFLTESVKINGLEVYYVEKETGKASKLNTNGTKTPCP